MNSEDLLMAQCLIVKGTTGSGKSWFVSTLVEMLGRECVSVAQFPMLKPQLKVMSLLKMLPLPKSAVEGILKDCEMMNVPTDRMLGGKLMGMLEVPNALSGGQRKKLLLSLAVRTAIVRRTRALILDEPFAGIDINSMPNALNVLKLITASREMKLILVTHDHFRLIDEAFGSSTHLTIDARQVYLHRTPDSNTDDNSIFHEENSPPSTLTAAKILIGLMDQQDMEQSSRKLNSVHEHVAATRSIDIYLVKRHFIEGEYIMPLIVSIIFSCLSGLAAYNYTNNESDILKIRLAPIYCFLKNFIMEYTHFGSILNYCFKYSQHIEDVRLLLTRKRIYMLEIIIIAIIQSLLLTSIMNFILYIIAGKFWWINWKVILLDLWYSILTTAGYHTAPLVQPNPLIVMASIFPYVAAWGIVNGVLMPRELTPKGARFLTFFSPVYHYSCAVDGVAGSELQLLGSNCQHVLFHICFISPLFFAFSFALIVHECKHYKRYRAENFARRTEYSRLQWQETGENQEEKQKDSSSIQLVIED